MLHEKMYLNIHTHRKPQSPQEFCIRNAFFPKRIESISHLPYAVSVGIHPWFAGEKVMGFAEKMDSFLAMEKVIAVGEIGLDRVKNVPFSQQIEVFEQQLFFAEKYQKPVILHCVKAISDIFPYLKKTKVPFIFHQFDGNETQLKQLLPYPAYFSFGKNLFTSAKSQHVFTLIPENRYFLETDVAAIRIEKVYKQAALLKNISEEKIKEQILNTYFLADSTDFIVS